VHATGIRPPKGAINGRLALVKDLILPDGIDAIDCRLIPAMKLDESETSLEDRRPMLPHRALT
jgi:hypothetical protein